jgi:hypothetical protein
MILHCLTPQPSFASPEAAFHAKTHLISWRLWDWLAISELRRLVMCETATPYYCLVSRFCTAFVLKAFLVVLEWQIHLDPVRHD